MGTVWLLFASPRLRPSLPTSLQKTLTPERGQEPHSRSHGPVRRRQSWGLCRQPLLEEGDGSCPPPPSLVLLAPTWHANSPTPTPQGKVRPHAAHSLKQRPICCARSHSTPAHPPPATKRSFIAHHWPRQRTERPPPPCSSCTHSTGCLPPAATTPGVRRLLSGSPCPSLASPVNPRPLPAGLTPTSRLFPLGWALCRPP